MKKFICVFVISFFAITSYATHLKGGWIQYEYLGPGTALNSSQYKITVKQYLLCTSSGQQIDQSIVLGIFDQLTNKLVKDTSIDLLNDINISKTTFDQCISNTTNICYKIDTYIATVELPNNPNGYVLSVQTCCRIAGIKNVVRSEQVGITYMNTIPGVINGVDYHINNSPAFAQKDTAVVCFGSPFTFDFGATDADSDSLVYIFCNGLNQGGASNTTPGVPPNPPYNSIPYLIGFSGSSPLGNNVTINSATGLISGIAPSVTGDYVVAVCALEYRNGVLIGSTKKEIHIAVTNCSITAAILKPIYLACSSFSLNFQNESTASNIASYAWNFGVTNITTDTSSKPTPTYTFPDTGVFTLKLKVTTTGGCADSTTALVKVFPGFAPNFSVTGSCYLNSYVFKDLTYTKYGVVDTWFWNFGETSVTIDTSSKQNPTYLYPSFSSKTISFHVTNSKGCDSTITTVVNIAEKPAIHLPFKDTLICDIDTLPLFSSADGGTYAWSPNYNIIHPNTANPLVYPKATTTYILTVNNNGCINKDSIKVNVLNYITVDAGPDTLICQTDNIHLSPISSALSYQWTSSTGVPVSNVKSPTVQPLVYTKYYVIANLGKCQTTDSVAVYVSPYPTVSISADSAICFGNRTQLHGSIAASTFSWSPANTLLNANTLNPIAGPGKTTQYILSAQYTIGCVKTVSDTITVTVVQPFTVNAGRDTSIVIGQPLQLRATTNITDTNYLWTPATGLSSRYISSPIDVLNITADSIIYKVRATNSIGCFAEDELTVHIFKSEPDIFVPSGFTPNGDGLNDVLKPIPVGIVNLQYFRIYNRLGQMLYSTSDIGKGWDGAANGIKQPSGAYVYMAQGVDYNGKTIFRKGTVVLIR